MKKIVLTGGGTAGHVYPALALLPYLKGWEIHYIGGSGIEKEVLKNFPKIKYHEIETVKLVRKLTPKNLLIPFKMMKSITQSKKILKKISPDVIFSKGGFVSVPVVIAGNRLKIKTISHESDLSMGLANKINLKFCKSMCTSFQKTANISPKCIWTGQPIRKEIFEGNPSLILSKFTQRKPVLLVVGGSLGAKFINEKVIENIDLLTKNFNIIHITGNQSVAKIEHENYVQIEFSKNIQDLYSACDIALSRAGAGVIFELLALAKPMLLIPLSKKCSRGDQIENAELFEKLGYAGKLEEEEFSNDIFLKKLEYLNENKTKFKTLMKKNTQKNACKEIVKLIEKG